jgi:hypothetical protein
LRVIASNVVMGQHLAFCSLVAVRNSKWKIGLSGWCA